MKQLTEPQLLEFTDDLDRISVAVGAVRQNRKLGNGTLLTQGDQDALLLCQKKLFRASARVYTKEILLNEETIHAQLATLKRAMNSIDITLSKIETADQVTAFSALALDVATAVSSGDDITVAESLNGLLDRISKINS